MISEKKGGTSGTSVTIDFNQKRINKLQCNTFQERKKEVLQHWYTYPLCNTFLEPLVLQVLHL